MHSETPKRLVGLTQHLSRQPELPAQNLVGVLLFGAALFVAGLAIGLAAISARVALPSRAALNTQPALSP